MVTAGSIIHRGPLLFPCIILILVAACSGPAPEPSAPPTPAATPADGLASETSMQPSGMIAETNFQALLLANAPAINILQNAAFGNWNGDVPAQWDKSPTSGTLVRKADRLQDEKPVIEVIGEKEGASLSQKVAAAAALKPGQRYVATVWMRVLGPADLMLARIGTSPAGEEAQDTGVTPHPGDGSWHKLEVAWQVPAQLMPGLREIRFQVRMMNPGTMEIAGPEVIVK